MINTTLANRRSSKLIFIGVSLFLAFQASRKSYKYFEFRLTSNEDLFHARSSIRDGDSDICRIKWTTHATDSPSLTLERA